MSFVRQLIRALLAKLYKKANILVIDTISVHVFLKECKKIQYFGFLLEKSQYFGFFWKKPKY